MRRHGSDRQHASVASVNDEPTPELTAPPGTLRVGSVGGIPVLVRPSWFIVAALIAWIVAPMIEHVQPGMGALKYVVGVLYAVLFYMTILLHEASHALMARHFDIPVSWIMLHFLGGQTDIESEPATPGQEFKIAVVGPLTSIAVGLVALFATRFTGEGVLDLAVIGVAVANLVLGVLNLIPGLPLDGGRVLRAAVWSATGNPLRGTVVAAWGGRIAALLVLCWPVVMRYGFGTDPGFTNYLFTFVAALFLWQGATMAMLGAKVRRRLPALKARPLARRAIAVPEDLSLAEAVRRAQEAGAGAILTHSADERVVGLVNEDALLATPEDRRPWVPVSSVSRSLEEGLSLPADIFGEDLVNAITRTPAAEYLLLEADGRVYGVLSTADVDKAFGETR